MNWSDHIENPKYWMTKDGRNLLIKDMDTIHIENCIKYLEKNPITFGCGGPDPEDMYYDTDFELTDEYIQAFKDELKGRNK